MQFLLHHALSAIGFGDSTLQPLRQTASEKEREDSTASLGVYSPCREGLRTPADDFSTRPASPCGVEYDGLCEDYGADAEGGVGGPVEPVEVVRTLRVYSQRTPQRHVTQNESFLQQREGDFCSAELQGASREVQIMRVHQNPDVFVAPELLSESLCSHILNVASDRWEPSKTSIGPSTADQSAYKSGQSPSRTSKSAMLKDGETPGVSSAELLACSLAQLPLQHLEPLVVVRYDPGEYFNQHHDGAFRPVTVLLYLNDVDSGGQTYFPALGLKISPMKGCGVSWKNITPSNEMDMRTLHAGLPPTQGTKFAVNCFFNKQIVRFARPFKAPSLLPPEDFDEFHQESD